MYCSNEKGSEDTVGMEREVEIYTYCRNGKGSDLLHDCNQTSHL